MQNVSLRRNYGTMKNYINGVDGMIYYNIPYSVEKNLAKAYNSAMEVLPND